MTQRVIPASNWDIYNGSDKRKTAGCIQADSGCIDSSLCCMQGKLVF